MVISHDHADDLAALAPFLRTNEQLTVWLPYSASAATKGIVLRSGARLRQEMDEVEVCQNVYLTGEMAGSAANEQALILDTSDGLVVVVGCAHPGIVKGLGVGKRSVTHCTGGLAIGLSQEAFASDYEPAGTGRIMAVSR